MAAIVLVSFAETRHLGLDWNSTMLLSASEEVPLRYPNLYLHYVRQNGRCVAVTSRASACREVLYPSRNQPTAGRVQIESILLTPTVEPVILSVSRLASAIIRRQAIRTPY